MLITVIAVIIALGYFFYSFRLAWVRASLRYLIGMFCFWAAVFFAGPSVNQEFVSTAGIDRKSVV